MRLFLRICALLLISLQLSSCNEKKTSLINKSNVVTDPIFFLKNPDSTAIHFSNSLKENNEINYFTYPYLYMGGAVSAGDINNDGLIDLFFTGNMVENKLYLNKGNFKFEDISLKSGVKGDDRWYTGSTMADVNGDGFLDIYVSVSGLSGNKKNQLFINNGDLTFEDKSEVFGLADKGNSVNATFFDYDNDGDLDVYVANYPITPFYSTTGDYLTYMTYVNTTTSGNLYRNDNGKFNRITKESGLLVYNLSLGIVATDINNDGWQDLYISSDFNSPDYLYINQKDGTFQNKIHETTSHTSFFGMGVDVADFNNDLYLDLFQMDMDAASNRRSKSNMASMDRALFSDIENAGFQTQYMQNALQLNAGILSDNLPRFQEISRLSGVSSTDWSWGPLFADLDNDGWKDIFVSNGTRREINNKDYFGALKGEKKQKDSLLIKSLRIPSEPIDNYVFKNNRDLTFSKVNKEWGIEHKGFSNGCVYVDLDNDGDLDIVTNNIDEKASVFENRSSEVNNYITLKFKGEKKNTFGLGVKVTLINDDLKQFQELTLSRGFQSSVAPQMHFGIEKRKVIDTIKVVWPNQKKQILTNIDANQLLTLDYKDAQNYMLVDTKTSEVNKLASGDSSSGIKTSPIIKQALSSVRVS